MFSNKEIQYLVHSSIDKKKWDDCIAQAPNGLVYAYSFYLDEMARHWDGLVLGDYEAVMPLTWNKKYTISYLYQPFLTAQLGVFGKNIDAGLLNAFLQSIPSKFKYWDFYLNHGNVFGLQDFEIYQRMNYVLHLDRPYDDLYNDYRENIRRNCKKAWQSGCVMQKDFSVKKVIDLAMEQMRDHSPETQENVSRFAKLYQYLYSRQMAITYGIASSQGELLASCVFFFSHKRAYYILVGNHPNGKTIGASHALIDAFIKDHAGKDIWLDFEGSDIRNLAFFYSSFGATE
ncbi:MAG TPA: hypothetical protein VHM26_09740, partial [Chitinophagaceae bacterium]|nr:hypothetical protein [Chitinophagaceae bacterium]